jgi:dolichyl-diphosphooligosaccharide--protein glycosyltransferase
LFVGVLGIFFTVALVHDFYRGRSPEHLAFVGAVGMAVLLVFLLVRMQSGGFGTMSVSVLHLFLAAGVGVGCVFLAALARLWERRDLSRLAYQADRPVLLAAAGSALGGRRRHSGHCCAARRGTGPSSPR